MPLCNIHCEICEEMYGFGVNAKSIAVTGNKQKFLPAKRVRVTRPRPPHVVGGVPIVSRERDAKKENFIIILLKKTPVYFDLSGKFFFILIHSVCTATH